MKQYRSGVVTLHNNDTRKRRESGTASFVRASAGRAGGGGRRPLNILSTRSDYLHYTRQAAMITTMAIRRPERASEQASGRADGRRTDRPNRRVPRNPDVVLLARQSPSLGYQLAPGSFLRRAGPREACDWVSFGLLVWGTIGQATQ